MDDGSSTSPMVSAAARVLLLPSVSPVSVSGSHRVNVTAANRTADASISRRRAQSWPTGSKITGGKRRASMVRSA